MASNDEAEFGRIDKLTGAFRTLVYLFQVEQRRDSRSSSTLAFDLDEVAKSLETSPRQLRRHLASLDAAGWIESHRKRRGQPSSVTFHYDRIIGGAPIRVWLHAWTDSWPPPGE